jgi:hypothetical protein
VVNVRDNCDIANTGIQIDLALLSKEWVSFYSIWISGLMRALKGRMKEKTDGAVVRNQAVRIRRSFTSLNVQQFLM